MRGGECGEGGECGREEESVVRGGGECGERRRRVVRDGYHISNCIHYSVKMAFHANTITIFGD